MYALCLDWEVEEKTYRGFPGGRISRLSGLFEIMYVPFRSYFDVAPYLTKANSVLTLCTRIR